MANSMNQVLANCLVVRDISEDWLANRFHRLTPDRQEQVKWSSEESEYLAKILQTKTSWKHVLNQMREKFGIDRSEASLRTRVKTLNLDTIGISNAQPWTDEEATYLKLLWEIQVPMKEQWRLFRGKFNNQRSEKALSARRISKGFGTGQTHTPVRTMLRRLRNQSSKGKTCDT
ncbi:hypothetical protein V8C37DRAFT_375360 [Trichoderma ceciliae]